MSALQILALSLLAMGAKEDSVGFSVPFASSYFAFGEAGFQFGIGVVPTPVYVGGPSGVICYDPCSLSVGTGPLVSSTEDSWVFAGGGSVFQNGITFTTQIPDCAAAGLPEYLHGPSGCEIPDSGASGHSRAK
jgi:hypothetical protein